MRSSGCKSFLVDLALHIAALLGLILNTASWTSALEVSVGGRRIDLDLTLSVREVIEANRSSTHERTLQTLRARTAVHVADWLRFDSTTVGTNGGPTIKSQRSGVYNWSDVFQENSPAIDFEEVFFDARLGSVDARVGKQRLSRGRLDRFSPNDLLNASNYLDPLLQDEAERKIGVPSVQVSYFPTFDWVPSESRLTAVWIPVFIPYRFGTASCQVGGTSCDIERWFPPAAVPPTSLSIPAGLISFPGGGSAPALRVPLSFQVENTPPPARRFENGGLGLQYSALIHDADVAAYYFHGYDPNPAFRLTAEAVGQADPNPANPLGVRNLTGATTLVPAFARVHAWGADAAYALDHFTLRGEAAYLHGRPLARDLRELVTNLDPLAEQLTAAVADLASGRGRVPVGLPKSFVTRDAVEWGLGLDCTIDGYLAFLQLNQTDVLRNDVDLLISNVETRLLLTLKRAFFSEQLLAQLVALYAVESDYFMLRPKLIYRITDHVAMEIGYLSIGGRAGSVIGQYRHNDEGWIRLELKS